jgi:hypothetical protein
MPDLGIIPFTPLSEEYLAEVKRARDSFIDETFRMCMIPSEILDAGRKLTMSFRCEFCGEAQPTGVGPIQVVTKIRHKGSEFEWKGTDIAEEKNSCEPCHDSEATPEVLGDAPASVQVVADTSFR